MTVCPSGQRDGPEIHWALPAGVRIPSLSTRHSCDAAGGSRGVKWHSLYGVAAELWSSKLKTLTVHAPSQTPLALHGPQLLKCGQPMASFVTLGGSHSSTSDRVHPAHDSVSERPRRWTRNPLGSARRGSNPLAVDKVQLRRQGWRPCNKWHSFYAVAAEL